MKIYKWSEDTPKKIRIKKRYITITPKPTDTQKYLERLLSYPECAEYIVEEKKEDNYYPDLVVFYDRSKELINLKMQELRKLYPDIKYNVKKDIFIDNILKNKKK